MGDFRANVVETWIFGGLPTDDNDRKIVEGMGVALSKLVDPDDGGVVEHVSRLSRFGSVFEVFRKIGELLCKPDVDLL